MIKSDWSERGSPRNMKRKRDETHDETLDLITERIKHAENGEAWQVGSISLE